MRKFLLALVFAVLSVVCASAQTALPVTPYPLLGTSNSVELTPAYNGLTGINAAVGNDGFLRFLSLQGQSSGLSGQLVFTQCTNQSCTTSVSNTISDSVSDGCYFGGSGVVTNFIDASMIIDSSGLARIAFIGSRCSVSYPSEDVIYIQCLNASCSSKSSAVISHYGLYSPGGFPSVSMGIAMETDGITAAVIFESCDNTSNCANQGTLTANSIWIDEATCDSGACTAPVDIVGPYTPINNGHTITTAYVLSAQGVYVGTDNHVRFAYTVITTATLTTQVDFYYYNNGTSTDLATYGPTSTSTFFNLIGSDVMALNSNNLATVVWPSVTTGGTTVVGCTNDLCTTSSQTTVTENLPASENAFYAQSIAITMGSNFVTILRGGVSGRSNAGPGVYDYITCSNATCTTYTLYNLVSGVPFLQTGGGNAGAGATGKAIAVSNSLGWYFVGVTLAPGQDPSCLTSNANCNGFWDILFSSTPTQPPPKYISRTFSSLVGDSPTLKIPVLTKPGKETFSYALFESPTPFVVNNQWQIPVVMAGVPSPDTALYTPFYPAVAAPTPLPAYSQPINDSLSPTVTSLTNGFTMAVAGWFFTDSSYVSHFFQVTGNTATTVAPDGSGYSIVAAGAAGICATAPCPTLTDVAGDTIVVANNTSSTFDGVVASFTDPSGVTMTTTFLGDAAQTLEYTDTLGMTAITAAQTNANSTPPSGALPTNTYAYTNPSGTVETFTVTYGSFTQETAFGCAGIAEVPATPVFLPIRVGLPDGSFYAITYETTPGQSQPTVTGRLASVTIPTGATISYAYSGANNGMNCIDGSVPTLKVTTPDGTTTYVHTP